MKVFCRGTICSSQYILTGVRNVGVYSCSFRSDGQTLHTRCYHKELGISFDFFSANQAIGDVIKPGNISG